MKELFSGKDIKLHSEWANKLYDTLPDDFSLNDILTTCSLLFLRISANLISYNENENEIDKKEKFKLLNLYIKSIFFAINDAEKQIDEDEKERK